MITHWSYTFHSICVGLAFLLIMPVCSQAQWRPISTEHSITTLACSTPSRIEISADQLLLECDDGVFALEDTRLRHVPEYVPTRLSLDTMHIQTGYWNDTLHWSKDSLLIAADRGLYWMNRHTDDLWLVPHMPKTLLTTLLRDEHLVYTHSETGDLVQYNTESGNLVHHELKDVSALPHLISISSNIMYYIRQKTVYAYNWLNNEESEYITVPHDIIDFQVTQSSLYVLTAEILYEFSLVADSYESAEILDLQAILVRGDDVIVGTTQHLHLIKDDITSIIAHANITNIESDSSHIYIGTFSNGLYVLDKNYKIIDNKIPTKVIGDESILAIHVAQDRVYLGTLAGLCYYQKTPEGTLSNDPIWISGLPNSYFLTIFSTAERLYAGTDRQGLYQVDLSHMDVTTLADPDSIGIDRISLYDIDLWNDTVVVASDVGLLKLANDSIRKVSSIPITISSHYGIEVRDELIYAYTPHGTYSKGAEGSITGLNLLPPGMTTLPVIRGTSASQDFLYYLLNDKIQRHKLHYSYDFTDRIKIQSWEANLIELPLGDGLDIHEKNNNITINLSYSDAHISEGWVVKYQLQNHDPRSRFTTDKLVSYPSLPPGSYNFVTSYYHELLDLSGPTSELSFTIQPHWYRRTATVIIAALLTIAVILLLVRRYQRRKSQKYEQEKVLWESRFYNLSNQVSPHFLFNSLNTLAGLIDINPQQSAKFAEKLSEFYRIVVQSQTKKLVRISDELSMLNIYIDLLQLRHKNSLLVDINISDTHRQIPPMSLQLLVENAMKHNRHTTREPLKISITQDSDYDLLIKNDIRPKRSSPRIASTKTGLKNLSQRVQMTMQKEVVISQTIDSFIVRLPTVHI